MTDHKHLKRRVRSRAATTGESYVVALRNVRRDLEDPVPTTNLMASCSFCGKPSTEVAKLVAGPGVFICDACVSLSASVIASTADEPPEVSERRRAAFADPSPADMLALLPALARTAAQVEADLARRVGRLRAQGTDWQPIAEAVGVSVEEAKRRFEAPLSR